MLFARLKHADASRLSVVSLGANIAWSGVHAAGSIAFSVMLLNAGRNGVEDVLTWSMEAYVLTSEWV